MSNTISAVPGSLFSALMTPDAPTATGEKSPPLVQLVESDRVRADFKINPQTADDLVAKFKAKSPDEGDEVGEGDDGEEKEGEEGNGGGSSQVGGTSSGHGSGSNEGGGGKKDPAGANDPNADDLPADVLQKLGNILAESDLISVLPEGLSADDPLTAKNLTEILQHNFQVSQADYFEKGRTDLWETIQQRSTPEVLDILNYQFSGAVSDEDVKSYIETIVFKTSVEDLDPNDPNDAEILVKEHARSTGMSSEDAADEIEMLKNAGQLPRKAAVAKKALIKRADEDKVRKNLEVDKVKREQARVKSEVMKKVGSFISDGKLANRAVPREVLSRFNAMVEVDSIPTKVANQTVSLPYLTNRMQIAVTDPSFDTESLFLISLLLDGKRETVQNYFKAEPKPQKTESNKIRFGGGGSHKPDTGNNNNNKTNSGLLAGLLRK